MCCFGCCWMETCSSKLWNLFAVWHATSSCCCAAKIDEWRDEIHQNCSPLHCIIPTMNRSHPHTSQHGVFPSLIAKTPSQQSSSNDCESHASVPQIQSPLPHTPSPNKSIESTFLGEIMVIFRLFFHPPGVSRDPLLFFFLSFSHLSFFLYLLFFCIHSKKVRRQWKFCSDFT